MEADQNQKFLKELSKKIGSLKLTTLIFSLNWKITFEGSLFNILEGDEPARSFGELKLLWNAKRANR